MCHLPHIETFLARAWKKNLSVLAKYEQTNSTAKKNNKLNSTISISHKLLLVNILVTQSYESLVFFPLVIIVRVSSLFCEGPVSSNCISGTNGTLATNWGIL